MNPFLLEHYLIPTDDWDRCPYHEAKELARRSAQDGVPAGIAEHDGKWYVLESSGQGPYVIWRSE